MHCHEVLCAITLQLLLILDKKWLRWKPALALLALVDDYAEMATMLSTCL